MIFLEIWRKKQLCDYFRTYWLHSLHEISAAISSKKFGDTFSQSLRPEEKRPHRGTSRSRAFRGVEMAVDFDLTRRNLITLRTGLRGSKTRNEASRRSWDDNVKVRYEFHRRSFPSKGFSICRYSEKDRRRSSPFA